MKPPPFDYVLADCVDHAVAELRDGGDDAKLLAGGQSLIPLLNLRLARPSVLIDVNRISRLADIAVESQSVRLGALVRHRKLEESAAVAAHLPLLGEAARWIAHPQIRTRGTLGGSLAHADAAAELPVALLALDATVTVRSPRGERRIPIADLSLGHLISALQPDEMITEVSVPRLPAGSGSAFCEFARRHGDYAIGAAACVLTLADDGACTRARITVLGGGATAVRAEAAEHRLIGTSITNDDVREAAVAAISDLSPTATLHGDAEHRRDVIRAMVERAVRTAARRTRSTP